jgi:hypothetical protein
MEPTGLGNTKILTNHAQKFAQSYYCMSEEMGFQHKHSTQMLLLLLLLL